jgi:hypothetical protein
VFDDIVEAAFILKIKYAGRARQRARVSLDQSAQRL